MSLSFINHLNKLLAFLNTNNKTQAERNAVEFAIYEFVKLTIGRPADNIRSAYLSFTRPKKQKLVKSESNPEARRGRPIDYMGIANVLSGFSFLIGMFAAKKLKDGFIKQVKDDMDDEKIKNRCENIVGAGDVSSPIRSAAVGARGVYRNAKRIKVEVDDILNTKMLRG